MISRPLITRTRTIGAVYRSVADAAAAATDDDDEQQGSLNRFGN